MSEFWEDKRVFITGGTGFIGRYTVQALSRHGADLHVLARRTSDTAHARECGATIVEGNVVDRNSLIVPEDTDIVIHGAAWIGYGLTKSKQRLMWTTNVEGTRNVIDASRAADVDRFVYVSSVAAVGATPAGMYAEDRLDPEVRLPYFLSEYERTKWAAQQLVHDSDLDHVSVLPGIVLGLGGGFEGLQRAVLDGRIPRVPVGDAVTGVVHVRDVVAGILEAAEMGKGPYILVDENLTLRELLDLMADAARVPPIEGTIDIRWLKPAVRALQAGYHAIGKTPPVSVELLESAEAPKAYDARRARKELDWMPDTAGNLEADFEALKEGRRPPGA